MGFDSSCAVEEDAPAETARSPVVRLVQDGVRPERHDALGRLGIRLPCPARADASCGGPAARSRSPPASTQAGQRGNRQISARCAVGSSSRIGSMNSTCKVRKEVGQWPEPARCLRLWAICTALDAANLTLRLDQAARQWPAEPGMAGLRTGDGPGRRGTGRQPTGGTPPRARGFRSG